MPITASSNYRRAAGLARFARCLFAKSRLLAAAAVLAAAGNASAQIVWTPRATSQNWVSVASSADGVRLVAVADGAGLYTSDNSGVTWTLQAGAGTRPWQSVASSSTGQYLVAASHTDVGGTAAPGTLLISSNYGVTWTVPATGASGNWLSVSSSGNGQNLIATTSSRISTSSDFGANWTQRDSVRGWSAVAISSGSEVFAAADMVGPNDTGGQIYTATPATLASPWTATNSGDHGWAALAMSSTGTQIIAADYDGLTQGQLYKSTNTGGTWSPLTAAGTRRWAGVASSANGQNLVAVEGFKFDNGQILVSTDGGSTWTPQTTAGSRSWTAAASSSDGQKLVAAAYDGQLYTGAPAAAPTVSAPATFTVTEDVAGNLPYTGTPFADTDSTNLTVTLSVSDGTITGNAGNSITIGGTATARTFAGTIANLNAYFTTAGRITYTTALNNTAARTLTTRVSDGSLSNSASSTINITAVNDAPALTAISVSGTEDTPLNFTAANFNGAYSDPESTSLASITVVTLPATGTLKLSAANVTANQVIPAASLVNLNYVPAANENGAKTFTVTASDGTLSSTPATTVTMTLAAVNDAPTATNLSAAESYTEDTAKNLTDIVISDVDSGATVTATLTLSNTAAGSLSTATSGTVSSAYNPGTGVWTATGPVADVNGLLAGLTFTPSANFSANFTISTSISDGVAAAVSGNKAMTGVLVNDAPVANAQSISTSQDTAVSITLTGSDVENLSLTFSIVTQPGHGTLSGSGATRTYTPTEGYSGPDSFTFKVNDGSADSTPATVSITVGAPNQPPSFTLPKVPEGLWAWGSNDDGQLGNGNNDDRTLPAPSDAAADWASVACGAQHTVAIKQNGSLWAWGADAAGQLGNGDAGTQSRPQQILSPATAWKMVACGAKHTVAITRDGRLFAWGDNSQGQLGTGNLTAQPSPVQIGTAENWRSIACGGGFTVALNSDGQLWSWGNNSLGQLGRTTTGQGATPASEPGRVGTATDWQSVACGLLHNVALKQNGELWSWGFHELGQLGRATSGQGSTPASEPGRVGTETDWQSAAGGDFHTLAVKKDGRIFAWGMGNIGQLGLPNAPRYVGSPTQVGANSDWQSVTCGSNYSRALKRDGTLFAWGSNISARNDIEYNRLNTPAQIGSDRDWRLVVAGGGHTVALKRNNSLKWVKNGGQRSIPGFATNIQSGPPGEPAQTVGFIVTAIRVSGSSKLFSDTGAPAISPAGTLTFTPEEDSIGEALVTVKLQDGGGTAGGGQDTSGEQQFKIRIVPNGVKASDYAGNSTTIDLVDKVLINDTNGPVTLSNAVTMGGSSGLNSLPGQCITLTGICTFTTPATNLNTCGEAEIRCASFWAPLLGGGATPKVTTTGPGDLTLAPAAPVAMDLNFQAPQEGAGSTVNMKMNSSGSHGAVQASSVEVSQAPGGAVATTLKAQSFGPGSSPGQLSGVNGSWQAPVVYEWEISKADGTAGAAPGWDLLSFTGTFTLVPVSGEKHWISLRSLTTANVPGEMAAFNKNSPYAWKIVSATGGITGFSPDLFALDTSGIRNDFGGGSFGIALQNSNRDLVITYTPALRTGNWTSDATSGIDATRGTLWARRFGTAANATINGVTLTGTGFVVSSPEFDLAGPTANYNIDDVNALTTLAGQGSAEVAKRFVYGGNPATLTFKQLTPGYTYTATILTVGFDTTPNFRLQTFASGTDSRVLDPNVYGDNAGNRIDYTFTADAATRTLTITPQTAANTIAIYGVALRRETLLPPVLSAVTATSVTGSAATLNATVTAGDARAPVLRRGFVIAATADNAAPELGGPGVTDFPVSGTTGAFSQPLTGLFYGTPYSFAAYAENEAGISYSSVVTFTPVDTAPVTGVSIAASSSGLGAPFDRAAIHCIDDSGLTNGQHGIVPDGSMWLTRGTFQAPNDPLPAEITFDMGGTVDLDSIHVWNYNEAGAFTSRGCKDVTISVASSQSGPFTTVGNYQFAQAPGTANYAGERISFSRTNVRAVRFTITTNWGDANEFAGLSEVKFYKVLPSTDARLAALSISSGTLSPAFSPGVYSYTLTVPASVSSVTVTPTAVQAGSTISVGNTTVASGAASPAITLPAVGIPYLLSINVVAPSGLNINQYSVSITRVAAQPPVPSDFAMARNGANLGFTFTSATGRTYTLWRSDTLESGWTNTGLPAITGDGTVKTMSIPAPNSSVPKRYYRLQVQ